MRTYFVATIVGVACMLGGCSQGQGLDTPKDAHSKLEIEYTVVKGSSIKKVAEELVGKEVMSDTQAILDYMRQKKMYPGTYTFSASMTPHEIADVLAGKVQDKYIVRLVIPEGYTIHDIDALLVKQLGFKEGSFINVADTVDRSRYTLLKDLSKQHSLEGYFFPDTYIVDKRTTSPEQVAQQLLKTFQDRVASLLEDLPSSGHSLDEVITMASLIEKETTLRDDRAIVAGVLWKRIESGWYLGVDAALLYERSNAEGRDITYQDLQDSSPYNLRKHKGLPPTAIGNPGLSAIKAALYPKESAYWYYLHDSAGNIYYAKTDEEHALNKALYIQ